MQCPSLFVFFPQSYLLIKQIVKSHYATWLSVIKGYQQLIFIHCNCKVMLDDVQPTLSYLFPSIEFTITLLIAQSPSIPPLAPLGVPFFSVHFVPFGFQHYSFCAYFKQLNCKNVNVSFHLHSKWFHRCLDQSHLMKKCKAKTGQLLLVTSVFY